MDFVTVSEDGWMKIVFISVFSSNLPSIDYDVIILHIDQYQF